MKPEGKHRCSDGRWETGLVADCRYLGVSPKVCSEVFQLRCLRPNPSQTSIGRVSSNAHIQLLDQAIRDAGTCGFI